MLCAAMPLFAQNVPGDARPAVSPAKPPHTIYRNSDGDLITNDEFVDIRMANFHVRDATMVKTLEDGTVEFRLQKVPQEGAEAPAVTGRYIDGTSMDLASLRGKVVVLNFWFIGCPACRAQVPGLNETVAKFRDDSDVVFIAMTADPASAVKKYASSNPLDYKMVADAAVPIRSFVISGYPKNVVIGRDGRIAYWRSTLHNKGRLEAVIRAELEKK